MHEVPIAASGRLRVFADAGIISLADFHLARRMSHGYESDEDVLLAFALCARELRLGSVCLVLEAAPALKPLTEVDDGLAVLETELPWPEIATWAAKIGASRLVGERRAFRFAEGRLYLARYWAEERRVARALESRRRLPVADVPEPAWTGTRLDEHQRLAVLSALRHPTSVITGGPGTGKTTTVVEVLNALGADAPISIALAAPTGKAARHLYDSVRTRLAPGVARDVQFATLHRLLGMRVRGNSATHRLDNPLPHDVVVVDETSMVSLEHMAVLLDALAPGTRLILVGDPHQLRSVDAGAVLADIVANPTLTQPDSVVELRRNRRSHPDIAELALAIDGGDVERALEVIERSPGIDWFDFEGAGIKRSGTLAEDVVAAARPVVAAARRGDAAEALRGLRRHRILCAHRQGTHGVQDWARAARELIAERIPGYGSSRHFAGQPLLITRNSDAFQNGDVACLVDRGDRLVAAVEQGDGEPLEVSPAQLDDAVDVHAMTTHKAQGGQFETVSVVLPPEGSPLATRELVYTAVTRAERALRIYGSKAAFAEALATPVRRASGLGVSAGEAAT